jgi:predicted negative regulator of RcsB-dependent stress response
VFERAAKTGGGEVAAVAHLRVGEAMLGRENLARGQAVFRQAYAIPGVAGSLAGIYLADLHQRSGNQAAAVRVLNEVIEAGHEQSAPIARFRLGGLLMAQGDSEGAEAQYRAGFESGHPEAAPSCAANLGALLIQRQEMQEAITLLQFAINSNHPDAAPKAAATLGMLMAGAGQRDHAIGLLNLAATRGDKETAAAAAIRLAGVLVDDGQVREARQVLQATVNMKHERWSPRAQEALQALDEGAAARRRTALRGRTAQRKPKTR